jgi:hypothetical protein
MRKSSIILLVIILAACAPKFDGDDALDIAKDFVETRVKFYEGDNRSTVWEAEITVMPIGQDPSGFWVVPLIVRGPPNETNYSKKARLLVYVDGDRRRVVDVIRISEGNESQRP